MPFADACGWQDKISDQMRWTPDTRQDAVCLKQTTDCCSWKALTNISTHMILIDQKISRLALSAWEVQHSVAPPYHCPAFSFAFLLQFSGVLTFLGNWVQQSFQSSPPPWRLFPVSLRGLGQFWRAAPGDWEMSKAEKRQRAASPALFLFGMSFCLYPVCKRGLQHTQGRFGEDVYKRVTKWLLSVFFRSLNCLQTLHSA